MLSPIIIRASHSFIKQMLIRSLLYSKASSYLKVTCSELRAIYILTILSSGKNTVCAQEEPVAEHLVFLCFGLERNDNHF